VVEVSSGAALGIEEGYTMRWSAIGAALRKTSFILREEGPFVYADRARRALVVRGKRLFQDKRENLARWNALKNRYEGRRVFVIGNGPSLNRTPLHLLAGEYTMCFNRFHLMFERLAWRPTFYAATDDRVLADVADELNGVVPQVELAFFPDLHPYNVDFREHITARENVYWLWLVRLGFSEDLPYCGMNKTVTNVGLQILAFLGFRSIYLVGVDMDYKDHDSADKHNARDWTATKDDDPNHFDPRYFGAGRRYHHPRMDETLAKFREARSFLERRGVAVVNAGVGGRLEVFPRVSLREVVAVPRGRELDLLLAPIGYPRRSHSLRESIPQAVVLESAEQWTPGMTHAIVPVDEAVRVIPRAVFTHIVLGPFDGECAVVARVTAHA
jgi:hypothetical protein